jgi:hypothetical protein
MNEQKIIAIGAGGQGLNADLMERHFTGGSGVLGQEDKYIGANGCNGTSGSMVNGKLFLYSDGDTEDLLREVSNELKKQQLLDEHYRQCGCYPDENPNDL